MVVFVGGVEWGYGKAPMSPLDPLDLTDSPGVSPRFGGWFGLFWVGWVLELGSVGCSLGGVVDGVVWGYGETPMRPLGPLGLTDSPGASSRFERWFGLLWVGVRVVVGGWRLCCEDCGVLLGPACCVLLDKGAGVRSFTSRGDGL